MQRLAEHLKVLQLKCLRFQQQSNRKLSGKHHQKMSSKEAFYHKGMATHFHKILQEGMLPQDWKGDTKAKETLMNARTTEVFNYSTRQEGW